MSIKKFWNFSQDSDGGRVLRFDGIIAAETWWGDEVTPALFRSELFAGEGDISIWLNSPGGDCVAASQIYAMLMDYKGNITVKIDGIAASAASVIAMAGTTVLMAPTALMMIHNPMSVAIGDSEEMRKGMAMLDEVKESIINAYQIRTGQSRVKLSNLMDAETWLSAHSAIELKFADGMLEDAKRIQHTGSTPGAENYTFSRRAVTNSLLEKILPKTQQSANATPESPPTLPAKSEPPATPPEPEQPKGIPVESLTKRLSLILH